MSQLPDVTGDTETVDVVDQREDLSPKEVNSIGYVRFTPLHQGSAIKFSPIIVTSYDDAISVKASSEPVFGRMDPMRFFEGNERQVQMTFLTPQNDGPAAEAEFRKLKSLMSLQYPTYRTNPNVLEKPPLFKVEFKPLGDFGQHLLNEIGFLGGMSFNYLNPSEIINTPQATGAPRYFQVNFTLGVMHRYVTNRNTSFPFR